MRCEVCCGCLRIDRQIGALGPIEEEFPDVDAGLLPLDDINFDDPLP